MSMKSLLLRCLLATAIVVESVSPADAAKLKFATLAPEGSPWLNKWKEVAADFEKTSPVPVKIVSYPGGVMGDEPDMVKKLKFGQLQMLGVTVSGIAQLMPEILVLNLPFLFNNYQEVDYVLDQIFPEFQKLAEKRGLFLVGMLDQGMIEAFSKKRVRTADEFLKQRVWIWNADPVAIKLAKALSINAVMLSVPDVLTSLQTGLVDTMFSSTTALISLQWQTQMKYFYRFKLRYDPAAFFISTKAIKKVAPGKEELFKESIRHTVDKYFKPFLTELRQTEKDLAKKIVAGGIQEVRWDEAGVAPVREKAVKVWDELAGDLYPAELLAKVKSALVDYRTAHPGK